MFKAIPNPWVCLGLLGLSQIRALNVRSVDRRRSSALHALFPDTPHSDRQLSLLLHFCKLSKAIRHVWFWRIKSVHPWAVLTSSRALLRQ